MNAGGGTFVGRDVYSFSNIPANKIAQQFERIYRQIEEMKMGEEDKQILMAEVQGLEKEIAKGDQADARPLGRHLRIITLLSKDILQALVSCFNSPEYGSVVKTAMEKAQAEAFG